MRISPRSSRLPTRAVFFAAALAASSTAAWAGGRPDDEGRNWFGDFSGGWAFPQSDSSDNLDDDWSISGGATYWPSHWPIGLNFGLTYAKFDISDDAVNAINTQIALDPAHSGLIEGGDLENWQFTINAIWGPGDESNGFYMTGGVGVYDLKGELTDTGLVYYPPFCDPWYWWWCYPGGVGTGTVVRGSDSTTEFGYNLGLGYSFEVGDGSLFIETKYHWIDTDTSDVTYVPFTFGYRW